MNLVSLICLMKGDELNMNDFINWDHVNAVGGVNEVGKEDDAK